MEKEAPVKIDRKVSWAERLFKKDENSKRAKVEIQGKAKTEDESRKGWKSAPVEFFISNTNVETSTEDVKEAARNFAKIESIEIEKKTKEGATYGSFRIKVERQDYEKCINEDSWPQGWKIRKFFRNFKVKTDSPGKSAKVENKVITKKEEAEKSAKIENKVINKKAEEIKNNKELLSEDKEREKSINELRQLTLEELNEYKKMYKDTDWRYADCDLELQDRHIRGLRSIRDRIDRDAQNSKWTQANNYASSYLNKRNRYAEKWKRKTKIFEKI